MLVFVTICCICSEEHLLPAFLYYVFFLSQHQDTNVNYHKQSGLCEEQQGCNTSVIIAHLDKYQPLTAGALIERYITSL